MYKIATWNVNSIKVRLPQLLVWLQSFNPDVVALQETKTIDANFPVDAIKQLGYHVIFCGQKTYNGMAMLSKTKPSDIVIDMPGLEDPQRRFLAATIDKTRVVNIYVPNGQEVGSEKFSYKLNWLTHLNTYLKHELKKENNLVLLGDFNIAPEACDVHDPSLWEGHVLFSEQERKAFKELLACGTLDAFRLFEQPEKIYTWWDYRMLAFRRNHGLRMDHILLNSSMAKHCRACRVDREPRKWERPSDHAPVIAEFVFPLFP